MTRPATCASTDSTSRRRSTATTGKKLEGTLAPHDAYVTARNLVAEVVPAFVSPAHVAKTPKGEARLMATIQPDDDLYTILKAPVRPGTAITIDAAISAESPTLDLSVNAPYLIKGRDKLIRQTLLTARLSQGAPTSLKAGTVFPVKNDYAGINLDATASPVMRCPSTISASPTARSMLTYAAQHRPIRSTCSPPTWPA